MNFRGEVKDVVSVDAVSTASEVRSRAKVVTPGRRKSDDKVVRLIEDHRKAVSALDKAKTRLEQVRQRVEAKEGSRAGTRHSLLHEFPPMILGDEAAIEFEGHIPRHVDDVLRRASRALGPRSHRKIAAVRHEAELELKRMLGAHRRIHAKAQRRAGLTAARDAYCKAEEREQRLLARVAAARPLTKIGQVTLLSYLSELIAQGRTLRGNLRWSAQPLKQLAELSI